MKLLIDANISWRIKELISKEFDEVSHVLDFFNHNEKDSVIWSYAEKHEYTIVTNDIDFLNLLIVKGFPPKIILLKLGNQSTKFISEKLNSNKVMIEAFYNDSDLGIIEFR